MPNYLIDEVTYSADWEEQTYALCKELADERDKKQEGLIYLFREWLDLVSPAVFGIDEGLEGILV